MAEQKSIGIFKLLGAIQPLSGQKIVFIREGETVAEVFPEWIEESQLGDGYYLPFDLNIPVTLPKRANLKAAYKADPPLSEIGTIVSKRLALELESRLRTSVKHIYTSPSLASLQTAHAIQKVFQERRSKESTIRVSHLLATNGSAKKHWIAKNSLKNFGFIVDNSYETGENKISQTELNQEKVTQNIKQFLTEISETTETDTPVIIVCDSIAMALMVNEIRGETFNFPTENAYEKCMKMFPASSSFVCDLCLEKRQLLTSKPDCNLRPLTSIGISCSVRYRP
ncbi:unnamed protein product [Auanema sp. JU1783]|nr:unnamed protein product [Auanema sp. JU1783]